MHLEKPVVGAGSSVGLQDPVTHPIALLRGLGQPRSSDIPRLVVVDCLDNGTRRRWKDTASTRLYEPTGGGVSFATVCLDDAEWYVDRHGGGFAVRCQDMVYSRRQTYFCEAAIFERNGKPRSTSRVNTHNPQVAASVKPRRS